MSIVFLSLFQNSVYDGLHSLFPTDYLQLEKLEKYSGKLYVLSELLHCLHNSSKNEKIVIVSNHTKVMILFIAFGSNPLLNHKILDGSKLKQTADDILGCI